MTRRTEARSPSADLKEKTVAKVQAKIGGMSCSFCAETLRKAVGRLDGVRRVNVSLAHEEALVEFDPGRVD